MRFPMQWRRRRASRWLRLLWPAMLYSSCATLTAAELNLAEVRHQVREQAPSVVAQHARLIAAEQQAARADALPDPRLMLGIDNLSISGPDAWDLSGDRMTMRRIGLQQSLPSTAKRRARQRQADADIEAAQGELQRIRFWAEREAGLAWIAVWRAEAELGLWQALKTEAERAVDIAQAQFATDRASATDALAARAASVEVDVQLHAAEAEISAARAALSRWLPEHGQRALADLPDPLALRQPIEQLRRRLEQHAPLQAWSGRTQAAEAGVALAEAEKRPDLGLGISYGARSGLSDMLMLELSIDLPLFTRNRQDRDIAARRAEAEAVRADYEDALRQQRAQLEALIADWQRLGAQVDSYRSQLLPLSRDRSRLALSAFAHGAPLQPWLDARVAEIKTAREAIDLRAEHAQVWLQLDSLLPGDADEELRR